MRGIQVLKKSLKNMIQQSILLGRINEIQGTTRHVKVVQMKLDPHLRMYFNETREFVCVDKTNMSGKHDIVLFKQIKKPESPSKKFEIVEVVHKVGTQMSPLKI